MPPPTAQPDALLPERQVMPFVERPWLSVAGFISLAFTHGLAGKQQSDS